MLKYLFDHAWHQNISIVIMSMLASWIWWACLSEQPCSLMHLVLLFIYNKSQALFNSVFTTHDQQWTQQLIRSDKPSPLSR